MLYRGGHEILNVSYDSLIYDWESSTKEILSFLEYPYVELQASTVKQETRPISDVVKNYKELKRSMNGTIWSWLFER